MIFLNEATLSCPHCGFKDKRVMPDTGYMKQTVCVSCEKEIRASDSSCCVFCEHSDMYCLRKQEMGSCAW